MCGRPTTDDRRGRVRGRRRCVSGAQCTHTHTHITCAQRTQPPMQTTPPRALNERRTLNAEMRVRFRYCRIEFVHFALCWCDFLAYAPRHIPNACAPQQQTCTRDYCDYYRSAAQTTLFASLAAQRIGTNPSPSAAAAESARLRACALEFKFCAHKIAVQGLYFCRPLLQMRQFFGFGVRCDLHAV